jgi:hypothetical protein
MKEPIFINILMRNVGKKWVALITIKDIRKL